MAWLILLVIVLTLFLISQFKNYIRLIYLAIKLPGPHPFDPLGNVFILNNLFKALETAIIRYGSCRLVKCWITFVPLIVLMDPQDIKIVINNDKITKKSVVVCNVLKCIMGEGLVTNNGHQWKKNRKLIQPLFNTNVLETFTNIFLENAEGVVRLLKDEVDINIVSYLNQYVLRSAYHTILGISLSCDEAELQKKKDILLGHPKITHWILLKVLCIQPCLGKAQNCSKTDLQYLIKKLIDDNTKNQREPGQFKSLVDWLSEISVENNEFTEDDVVNEATTFVHASYETVRAALAYLLYCLAIHQDAQEKVIQELDKIYSNAENRITTNELNKMKYLEQCIKESMRLYPSAPFFIRQIAQEVTLGQYSTVLGNHVLPVGTNVVISSLLLHRLPHLFPEPLRFHPERFSKENINNIDPYSYIPFSRGPRNCIGYKYAILEMKTFIASLLKKYRVFLAPGHDGLKFEFNVTLIARGGIWLRFKDRNADT